MLTMRARKRKQEQPKHFHSSDPKDKFCLCLIPHPALEIPQRLEIFGGVVVCPRAVCPAHAVGEVFCFALHEHVHGRVDVAHVDLVADGDEGLEGDDLAAFFEV
jgi:hypothetical protein